MPHPRWSPTLGANLRCSAVAAGMSFLTPAGRSRPTRREGRGIGGRTYPAVVDIHGSRFTLGDGARSWRLPPRARAPGLDVLVGHRPARLWLQQVFLVLPASSSPTNPNPAPAPAPDEQLPKLAAIAAFYPSTDFTATWAARCAVRPDKELPRLFTELFDANNLYPPASPPPTTRSCHRRTHRTGMWRRRRGSWGRWGRWGRRGRRLTRWVTWRVTKMTRFVDGW